MIKFIKMKLHKNPKFKVDEVALAVIVILIAASVSIYYKAGRPQTAEAEKIAEAITDDHGMSFASGGVIDESKLSEVKNTKYADLKKSINAKGDFCIYMEDGNGKILLAKGSPDLNRDGLVCRE